MDDNYRRWLDLNRVILQKSINPREVLDRLVAKLVFKPEEEDYQVIMAERTRIGQTRELLGAVGRSGDGAFEHLREIIRDMYPHLELKCVPEVEQPAPI